MAAYKVLQDIEAEDKFLGPLTLKQFIFAGITAVCLYLSIWSVVKGAWPVTIILLPIAAALGFLAWPWSREQSTEVWLAARLRFIIKPRLRIWNQSGVKDLVTITVPKKVDKHLTNGLSQNEVDSRLEALANTLDSRGWAVKNVNVNLYATPIFTPTEDSSDRLVSIDKLPQRVEDVDVLAADDIMDSSNNPLAQQLDEMMKRSSQAHLTSAITNMQARGAAAQVAISLPEPTTFASAPAVPLPIQDEPTTEDEQALLEKIHEEKAHEQEHPESLYGHMKVIKPIDDQSSALPAPVAGAASTTPMTTPVDPAILELAKNDDLNVATIAREAERETAQLADDGEVVINLR